MTATPNPSTDLEPRPLSEEQWRLLMADPAGAAHLDGYDGPDRRHEPRREHREVMQLFLSLPGSGLGSKPQQRYLVRARDLSPSGLRFVHSEALPIDSACRVALLTKGQKLVHREAVVCTVTQQGPAHFEIGVRLDKPVKVEQF